MSTQELLDVLEQHQTDGFYVGEFIPPKKLQNAIAMFPIPLDIPVYGLIDTTLMGSCKTGLAITSEGLIWKNDWTTKSPRSSLSWVDLLERKNTLQVTTFDILFSKDAVLNMSSSTMSRVAAFHMLHDIIRLLESMLMQPAIQQDSIIDVLPMHQQSEVYVLPPVTEQPSQQVALPTPPQDSIYQEALVAGLALIAAVDGVISDEEVDLAMAFIQEEELITDKGKAIEDFESQLEKLLTQFERSSALFKLQAEKIIQLFGKVKDPAQRSQLHIMLTGIYELDTGDKNSLMISIWQKINDVLS